MVGVIPFKRTDVLMGWPANLNVLPTYTAGTSVFTTSAYFPWNIVGPTRLNLQNQFDLINVDNGIDLAIFQDIRPMLSPSSGYPLVNYTNVGSMYSPQTNNVSSST